MSQVDEGKLVPKAGAAAPLPGYGMPSGGLLSARQRWTPLVRLVSPAIGRLIGRDFADRMTAATLRERSPHWQTYDQIDMSLTPDDIERLVASFRDQDPETAADYGRMALTHDLAAIYERICADYAVPAARLSNLITAIMVEAWLATKHVQLTLPQLEGIRGQVESTLHTVLPELDPTLVREARVAMQCHFAVMFRANTTGRASGDPRQFDQLDAVVREWSAAVFGRDILDFEPTPNGFVVPSLNLKAPRHAGRSPPDRGRQVGVASGRLASP
jgi:hypothetical protein